MKISMLSFLATIIFIQFSYTVQFEDLVLFRSENNIVNENKNFLQQNVSEKVGLNNTLAGEMNNSTNQTEINPENNSSTKNNTQRQKAKHFLKKPLEPSTNETTVFSHISQNQTDAELSEMKESADNSTNYLCQEIETVLSNMIDVDNAVSELRESFLNNTRLYVEYSLQPNITDEEKAQFTEEENNLILNYINRINEINVLIQSFKEKLLALQTKKCENFSSESVKSQLSNTESNLKSLIQLIQDNVKELNLHVSFIAITSQ